MGAAGGHHNERAGSPSLLSGAFFGIIFFMNLYLLNCQTIQPYSDRILPLLPKQRQNDYARSRSSLSLGAGLLLSSLLGVHTDEDLSIGPYGKPSLAAGAPTFSLSHSRDHVLLGISDRPIGVDMESSDRQVPPPVQRRMCLPQEKCSDPLQVFTRKECAMKLTGLGFSLPLQQIDTTADLRWNDGVFHFYTTEKKGFVISVLTAEEALSYIQLLTPEELL